MKWKGFEKKATEKVNGFVIKAVNSRSIFVMLALAALVVAAAATNKWGG